MVNRQQQHTKKGNNSMTDIWWVRCITQQHDPPGRINPVLDPIFTQHIPCANEAGSHANQLLYSAMMVSKHGREGTRRSLGTYADP